MNEQERIHKILEKRNIRYIGDTEHGYNAKVIFEDHGKVKYGTISYDYYHRFGVNTLAVISDESAYPWFASNHDRCTIDPTIIDSMYDGSYKDKYPLLDLNKLKIQY